MQQRLPKNRVPVSVSIPFDELARIDEIAFSMNQTRSDFVLQAVKEKITKLEKQKEFKNV